MKLGAQLMIQHRHVGCQLSLIGDQVEIGDHAPRNPARMALPAINQPLLVVSRIEPKQFAAAHSQLLTVLIANPYLVVLVNDDGRFGGFPDDCSQPAPKKG